MPDSRRQFLAKTSLGLLGAAVSLNAETQEPSQLPPARLPPSALARPSALQSLPPPSSKPKNSLAWNSRLSSARKLPPPGA